MMRGVTTLHIKQYREYQLCTIYDSGEPIKIVNVSWNLKLNSKSLQIPSKGLRRNPYVNKSEAKISLNCPFKCPGF
jgi:hypothetical protein